MAIVAHSVAPIADDHAASTSPAPVAYRVQPTQEVAAYADAVTDTPPSSVERSAATNCGTTHTVTRVAASTPTAATPRTSVSLSGEDRGDTPAQLGHTSRTDGVTGVGRQGAGRR
jgi:hypothetical protein